MVQAHLGSEQRGHRRCRRSRVASRAARPSPPRIGPRSRCCSSLCLRCLIPSTPAASFSSPAFCTAFTVAGSGGRCLPGWRMRALLGACRCTFADALWRLRTWLLRRPCSQIAFRCSILGTESVEPRSRLAGAGANSGPAGHARRLARRRLAGICANHRILTGRLSLAYTPVHTLCTTAAPQLVGLPSSYVSCAMRDKKRMTWLEIAHMMHVHREVYVNYAMDKHCLWRQAMHLMSGI